MSSLALRVAMPEVMSASRKRRRLVWLLMFALPLFALLAFMRLGVWLAAPAGVPVVADAVVVLGGDGGNERATRAGELFRAGFARQVVLTGNAGKPGMVAEAKADPRVNLLINMGVPTAVLLFDSVSRNSWEEAVNARQMMDEKRWQRVLVVSDPPHLRRLDMAFRHALKDGGQQFVLVATEAGWWQPETWWSDKRSASFVKHETLGLLYYAMRIVFAGF